MYCSVYVLIHFVPQCLCFYIKIFLHNPVRAVSRLWHLKSIIFHRTEIIRAGIVKRCLDTSTLLFQINEYEYTLECSNIANYLKHFSTILKKNKSNHSSTDLFHIESILLEFRSRYRRVRWAPLHPYIDELEKKLLAMGRFQVPGHRRLAY